MYNPHLARTNMVLSQIVPTVRVSPPLYEAMLDIPRHLFVPEQQQGIAYMDEHIPLGNQHYLMSPSLFAQLVEPLSITPEDTVLDVGCTIGYSAAIFARLAKKVIALESDSELASKANHTLHSLHITNTIIISNHLAEGHPEAAPYDVIFFNGAVEYIPATLFEQLAENGRLIAVLYHKNTYNSLSPTVFGEITLFTKNKDLITKREIAPTTLFPLAGF